MAKKDRMCGNKVKHKTHGQAMAAWKRQVNAGLEVYHCPRCKNFHLGRSFAQFDRAWRIGELLARHEAKLQKRMEKYGTRSNH